MHRLLAFHDCRMLDRQFLLADDKQYRLGRADDNDISTTWDDRISRHHASLQPSEKGVRLQSLDAASNPVFVDGRTTQDVVLKAGQSFVIGATRFEVQQVTQSDSPRSNSVQQLSIDRQQLEQLRYEDADKRIEVLTSLPAVIRESGVERDLFVRLANLLLAGIQHAEGVAVVALEPTHGKPVVLHQERRFEADGSMQPSSRLISNSFEQRRTVLHVWDESDAEDSRYTQHAGFNWAFCTPFHDLSSANATTAQADASARTGTARALYIAGHSPGEGAKTNQKRLHADIKFTEFIAEIVGSLQRQRELERQQTGLRQFFSPPVLEALGKDLDTSLLEPRECDVTVLFCDLRGFSQHAEEQADDLTGLLERVSLALEVMTSQILRFGGVTGDFQGDAALGFWGWPISSDEAPLNACRAALAIREEFAKAHADPDHPLTDFETSIGIAHGRAVAGKIGTREQVKVTVFGPVVNLASRLEGMTRQLHVPILIDDNLDRLIRENADSFDCRVRRLLHVLPYGMDNSLVVSELVPSEEAFPLLTNQHLADFETGLQRFIDGDWSEAWRFLHSMSADDRAQDFLAMQITQHGRTAPADWDGIVRMKKKDG
ncbi:MAG TPA: FHA domain-containing protein [Planctomycetes bacterium]|nr:FHA domain-containing protein [Fuerstiella sp.]HIK92381.1 FHA domain-containing protein [Planctomycetota bacterium]